VKTDHVTDDSTGGESIGSPSVGLRTLDGSVMEAADSLAARALRPHLLLATCFVVPLIGCASVWGATFNVGQMNSVMGNGGIEAAISPAFGAAAGCLLFAWLIVTFRPLRESLADGAAVLEGGGPSVEAVVAAIGDCADRRCREPFEAWPRDLDGVKAFAVRNGNEYGLITVRAVGEDLFIGWSLWRRRSTARLLGQVLSNLTEPARENPYAAVAASSFIVMREQLHCMTREGARAGTRAASAR
jgi:hypothetical protein